MAVREKRQFSRVAFNAFVRVMAENGEWESQLLDISLRGALIARPDGWQGQAGEPHALTVILSDHLSEIHMDAKLVHETDQVLGFRCNHIDLDSMSHLKRLVELNLGDEELLYRELSALLDSWSARN